MVLVSSVVMALVVPSGGTGSGKTTLINVLGSFIPANERVITCEDSLSFLYISFCSFLCMSY